MKISKIAIYLIVLPVLVIVVASSLFLAFFDANDYKQELVDYVKQSSGRSLVFKGDAELMLYPAFGMKLGAMEFSNAPGFGTTPMLSVDEVSISVDVKSVLMLQPKVSQLILSELQIDLQKNKQGVTNWDDLIPKKAEETATQQPQKQSTTKTSGDNTEQGSDFELAGAFEGININNATVSWRDAATGETFKIDDLDFTTGKITPTEAFPLSLQLVMHQQKAIKADISFETNVFFDLKKQTLSLQQLDLQLKASGTLIPVDNSEISLTANVNFDIEKQFLSVSKLLLKAETQGGIMQKTDVALAGDLTMNLATQYLKIAQLQLNAAIKDSSMPKGAINTSIKSKQLAVALNQRKVDLTALELGLNDILFKGEIHVKDYAQPALSFNLSTQELDLDELLGLSDKKDAEAPVETTDTTSQAEEDVEIALPTELLRKLDLEGQLSIGKLKVMNVKTSNNELKISAKKGVLQIKPLALDMYDGQLNNQITIDVRPEKPKFSIQTNLNKVQIGSLLIDFMQEDKISGAATIAIDVSTEGSWVSKLKQNLNGSIALRFADGALKGFNLRHLSDVAKAKLSGSDAPTENTQETDFTELKLSGKIKNGVFYSNDLSLKSPLIRVGGEGQADLNKNTVDYTVNAKIIGSLEGQAGAGLEASGLLIPVRIFGAFSALKTDILLDNMLKQQAQESIAKTKAAIKAQQQAKIDAEKQALKLKQNKLNAELKAKQDAEKQKLAAKQAAEKAKLQAKVKAAEDAAKKKLENKLKGLFN